MNTCRMHALFWTMVVTLIPVIVSIALLKLTVIPNYHGAQFEAGTCLLKNSSDFDVEQYVWQDCSCGISCTAKFPCIPLVGYFTPLVGGDGSKREGLFYTDYSALQKECFVEPDKCEKDSFDNSKTVASVISHTFHLHWDQRASFHCWGFGKTFYLENKYSIETAMVAFFTPLFFVISVPSLVCMFWYIFS